MKRDNHFNYFYLQIAVVCFLTLVAAVFRLS